MACRRVSCQRPYARTCIPGRCAPALGPSLGNFHCPPLFRVSGRPLRCTQPVAAGFACNLSESETLVRTFVLALSLLPWQAWGFWGAENYHECILKEMPGAKNTPYVAAVMESCRKRFPESRDRYAEEISRTMGVSSATDCVLKFAKNESLIQSAGIIQQACHALFPENPQSAPRPRPRAEPQSTAPTQFQSTLPPVAPPPLPTLRVRVDPPAPPSPLPPQIARNDPTSAAEVGPALTHVARRGDLIPNPYDVGRDERRVARPGDLIPNPFAVEPQRIEPARIEPIPERPLTVQKIAGPGGEGFTWMRGGIIPVEQQPEPHAPLRSGGESSVVQAPTDAAGLANAAAQLALEKRAVTVQTKMAFKSLARQQYVGKELPMNWRSQFCSGAAATEECRLLERWFAIAKRRTRAVLAAGTALKPYASIRALLAAYAQDGCDLSNPQSALLGRIVDTFPDPAYRRGTSDDDLQQVRACLDRFY